MQYSYPAMQSNQHTINHEENYSDLKSPTTHDMYDSDIHTYFEAFWNNVSVIKKLAYKSIVL